MSFHALLSGLITVTTMVIVGWAFHRKPLRLIPATVGGAMVAAVVMAIVSSAVYEVLVPTDKIDGMWVLTNGTGVWIGFIIANSLLPRKAKAKPSVVKEVQVELVTDKEEEPSHPAVYHQPGEQFEQPRVTLRTPTEWLELLTPGTKVRDPDGWRVDGTPFDKPISEAEFHKRLSVSTIEIKRRAL